MYRGGLRLYNSLLSSNAMRGCGGVSALVLPTLSSTCTWVARARLVLSLQCPTAQPNKRACHASFCSQVHVGGAGPVSAVMSENWVVYHYTNAAEQRCVFMYRVILIRS